MLPRCLREARGVLENRADEIMPPKVLSACLVPRKSLINVSYFFFHVADFWDDTGGSEVLFSLHLGVG